MPLLPAIFSPRRFRCRHLLCASIAVLVISNVRAQDDNDFYGHWTYKQTCGDEHSAELTLTQTAMTATGHWSDGTRLSGSDGLLKGRVADGELFVRFWGSDENAGYAICPTYEAEENNYFVRNGSDLICYQGRGKRPTHTFGKYLVLRPSIKGKPAQVEVHCTDEDR